jgi:hypothetical protein
LGYDVAPGGGRLLVNEAEAEQVREIFAIAAAAKSLEAAGEEITQRGIKTKQWTSRNGRIHEGKPFGKSTLRGLLSNVLYIGSIRHKGTVYAGEQAAIVDKKVWQKVNRQLQGRSGRQAGRRHQRRGTAVGGIAGMWALRCGDGAAGDDAAWAAIQLLRLRAVRGIALLGEYCRPGHLMKKTIG